jgi:hypothetical protein
MLDMRLVAYVLIEAVQIEAGLALSLVACELLFAGAVCLTIVV